VEAKLDGNGPGPAILLWPGDDRWPGQEIDLAGTAVDGVQKATTTSQVPTEHDPGGMSNVIGFNNNSSNTALTIREVEYSPL
jgi:hypothetical protein